jgi:hypothetical protein
MLRIDPLMLFICKSFCLFIPTFFVVYGVGTGLLFALYSILTGTPLLMISRDLAGVPFIYYAFGTALPIALLATVIVWGVSTAFAAIGGTSKGFLAWLTFLAIIGVIVGCLAVVPVLVHGASEFRSAGSGTSRLVAAYVISFALVGCFCCILLSPLWFLTFSRWLSPNT